MLNLQSVCSSLLVIMLDNCYEEFGALKIFQFTLKSNAYTYLFIKARVNN